MPSPTGRETFFRSKSVVLTERDELAFSRVLREFDPEVKIFGGRYDPIRRVPVPEPNIPHGTAMSSNFLILAPDEKERANFLGQLGYQVVDQAVGFDLRRSRLKWFDPSIKWAFDPPLLDWGEVGVCYPADCDEKVVRFASKLLRLVNKVTWKRTGFGLDACRWSQSDRDKTRHGLGAGVLIDPAEKIELNKYYDDSLWGDCLPDEPTGCRVEYDYPAEIN